MRIKLSKAGKRFNREWIFRHADLQFASGKAVAVTGPNGSGKSTFLQCLGGMLQLSEGTIVFEQDGKPVNGEQIHRELAFCAPYLEVIEELTLREFLQFHQQFKPLLPGRTVKDIMAEVGLEKAADKQIRFYSSGMKQRVKLAQAIFTDAGILLLDEPCSNLDARGIELYHSLISNYTRDRIVIVCSNDEVEYSFCQERMSIMDFK